MTVAHSAAATAGPSFATSSVSSVGHASGKSEEEMRASASESYRGGEDRGQGHGVA